MEDLIAIILITIFVIYMIILKLNQINNIIQKYSENIDENTELKYKDL